MAYCRNPDQGSVFFFPENVEGIGLSFSLLPSLL
jgi:hypothetical protein